MGRLAARFWSCTSVWSERSGWVIVSCSCKRDGFLPLTKGYMTCRLHDMTLHYITLVHHASYPIDCVISSNIHGKQPDVMPLCACLSSNPEPLRNSYTKMNARGWVSQQMVSSRRSFPIFPSALVFVILAAPQIHLFATWIAVDLLACCARCEGSPAVSERKRARSSSIIVRVIHALLGHQLDRIQADH